MKIKINLLKRNNNKDVVINKTPLHKIEFEKIVCNSLNKNPLLQNKNQFDHAYIIVNIIYDGDGLILARGGSLAHIYFDDYIIKKSSPMILNLHYGTYLGIDPDELEKILDNQFDCFNDQAYESLRKELTKLFDIKGIYRLLYHEFAHVIDATSPSFDYKKNLATNVDFQHLWNCYINRRLQNLSPYDFPDGKSKAPHLSNELDKIWNSEHNFSFDDLQQLIPKNK